MYNWLTIALEGTIRAYGPAGRPVVALLGPKDGRLSRDEDERLGRHAGRLEDDGRQRDNEHAGQQMRSPDAPPAPDGRGRARLSVGCYPPLRSAMSGVRVLRPSGIGPTVPPTGA